MHTYLENDGTDALALGYVGVCQLSVKDHLCQLVPYGVAQVACSLHICQMVVPGCEDHCREGEQLILAHKSRVSCALQRGTQSLSLNPCAQALLLS